MKNKIKKIKDELAKLDDEICEAITRGDLVKRDELIKQEAKLERKLKREEIKERKKGAIFKGPNTALAAVGLVPFITNFLLRISHDYKVVPPYFEFGETNGYLATIFANNITLSREFINTYDRDPVKTQSVLRYILAHEFRHYLTIARHIPLPRKQIDEDKRHRIKEAACDEFAMSATGLSLMKMKNLMYELRI